MSNLICATFPFDPEQFKLERRFRDDQDFLYCLNTSYGRFTVLDRMTGFGWRDVESGFRDRELRFWLASGDKDVRYSGAKTLQEAADWIKAHANSNDGSENIDTIMRCVSREGDMPWDATKDLKLDVPQVFP